MGENTGIQWCDHTRNFWSGCTKVSDACTHCYAETLSRRNGSTFGKWGKGAPRAWHGDGARKELLKWNRLAADNWHRCECGWKGAATFESNRCPNCQFDFGSAAPARPRVFLNSMSDWLDDEVPLEWLALLLDAARVCRNLDILLLTKRPENWLERVDAIRHLHVEDTDPTRWNDLFELREMVERWTVHGIAPENFFIGATVESPKEESRIEHLLKIPAAVRFLSCEPLLGPVKIWPGHIFGEENLIATGNFRTVAGKRQVQVGIKDPSKRQLHWVITGGESGRRARPSHPDWFRSLRDECAAAGVAFFHKQNGEWAPDDGSGTKGEWHGFRDGTLVKRGGLEAAGRLLDGREHNEFPQPTYC